MSSEPYTYIEQDHIAPNDATDDLPTYDDLAAQNGPNSRRVCHSSILTKRFLMLLGTGLGGGEVGLKNGMELETSERLVN